MRTIRVIISGRVQGVGYRAWTVATANKLNIKGWVRNLSDGTVEALFSGADPSVSAMFEACKKGPPASHVDRIETFTSEIVEDGPFVARPTV
jgi:acylphosphatase